MVLTFSSGASDGDTECLAIIITDDDALETEETFSVTLTVSELWLLELPTLRQSPLQV